MAEANLPTAKKDMLVFALKEKELQLKHLEEVVAQKKKEQEKKEDDDQKMSEEKKEEAAAEEKKKEGPPRLSQLITTASQTVVTDFLKNKSFLDQVSEAANGDEL